MSEECIHTFCASTESVLLMTKRICSSDMIHSCLTYITLALSVFHTCNNWDSVNQDEFKPSLSHNTSMHIHVKYVYVYTYCCLRLAFSVFHLQRLGFCQSRQIQTNPLTWHVYAYTCQIRVRIYIWLSPSCFLSFSPATIGILSIVTNKSHPSDMTRLCIHMSNTCMYIHIALSVSFSFSQCFTCTNWDSFNHDEHKPSLIHDVSMYTHIKHVYVYTYCSLSFALSTFHLHQPGFFQSWRTQIIPPTWYIYVHTCQTRVCKYILFFSLALSDSTVSTDSTHHEEKPFSRHGYACMNTGPIYVYTFCLLSLALSVFHLHQVEIFHSSRKEAILQTWYLFVSIHWLRLHLYIDYVYIFTLTTSTSIHWLRLHIYTLLFFSCSLIVSPAPRGSFAFIPKRSHSSDLICACKYFWTRLCHMLFSLSLLKTCCSLCLSLILLSVSLTLSVFHLHQLGVFHSSRRDAGKSALIEFLSMVCVWHDSWHDSFVCGTSWYDMTHSYVGRDSFICGTWLIHMWDILIWHDSFICFDDILHYAFFLFFLCSNHGLLSKSHSILMA